MNVTIDQLFHSEKIPYKTMIDIVKRLQNVAESENKELVIAIYQDSNYQFHWIEPEQTGKLESIEFQLCNSLSIENDSAMLVCIIHSHLLNLSKLQFSNEDNKADRELPYVVSGIIDCAAIYQKDISLVDLKEEYFKFRTYDPFKETFISFKLDRIIENDRL